MTKEESLAVTEHIARVIAERSPKVEISSEEMARARARYSEKELEELTEEGYYKGDFELFFTMLRFLEGMDLWRRTDEAYRKKLFSLARRFQPLDFLSDPYRKAIPPSQKRIGAFLLTEAKYEKGEFFQYDMPTLRDEIVVPRIGFFSECFSFPAVYEGVIPWVSICPSEVYSMTPDVEPAHGRVLVLGLGLGYYPFHAAQKKDVEQITVIERSPEILQLFREEILPHFPHKEKIRLVQADAFSYLNEVENGAFDFCYADIWEGWEDGAVCYDRILPHEKRLFDCEFRYWIRDEIQFWKELKETD